MVAYTLLLAIAVNAIFVRCGANFSVVQVSITWQSLPAFFLNCNLALLQLHRQPMACHLSVQPDSTTDTAHLLDALVFIGVKQVHHEAIGAVSAAAAAQAFACLSLRSLLHTHSQ